MKFRSLLLKRFFSIKEGLVFFLLVFLLRFKVSFAADNGPITKVSDITALADKIAFWVASIFWVAAIVAIFYAGFLYLTAGDDSERVKKAKKQLMYSIIAIALGIMAYGMPALVDSFLQGK